MSLETAIEALTAAVQANTAALLGHEDGAEGASEGKSATRGRRRKSTESGQPDATAASPAPAPATTPAPPTVSIEQFTKAFVALAETSAKGHAAAVQILADFKVERASLIPAAQLPAALKAVEEAQKAASAPAPAASLV